MNSTESWFEYRDEKGRQERIPLSNSRALSKKLPGLKLTPAAGAYLAQTNLDRLVLNGRPVKEAKLKHMDTVVWDGKFLVYHAQMAKPMVTPPSKTKKSNQSQQAPSLGLLFPWDLVFMPHSFWPRALNTPFGLWTHILFTSLGVCSILALPSVKWGAKYGPLNAGVYLGFASVLGGLLIMATCLQLGIYKKGSFLKAFRFSAALMPVFMMMQSVSMIYGMTTVIAPTLATMLYAQFRHGLPSTFMNAILFAAAFVIPWYALMTGVMSLLPR